MKTDDEKAFNEADFYSCDADAESLSDDNWEGAIGEFLDCYSPEEVSEVTIYAYKRAVVKRADVEAYALNAAISFHEELSEEYGDRGTSHEVPDELWQPFLRAAQEYMSTYVPWRCKVVAQREMSREEVIEWAKKEMPEWWDE